MNNVYLKESRIQGTGAFAGKDFKKGEFILTIDDTHEVDEDSLTEKQKAFDCDWFENKVILMQPPEKNINHSCDPNTYVKTINNLRQVLAMKDIKKDEELTFDYSMNGDNEGTFKCHCGSPSCRRIYVGNFFKLPKETQVKYLPFLDNWFIEKYKDKLSQII